MVGDSIQVPEKTPKDAKLTTEAQNIIRSFLGRFCVSVVKN